MNNPLYPVFHEKNLSEFARLLAEAEDMSDPIEEDVPAEDKSPAQMQEDDIFSKVKQENESDVDTNAYSFLGRQDDGSLGGINNITNDKDPAINSLCNVIKGNILSNSDDSVGYVTALFDTVGANDISPEDFEKIKGSIWKKLEEIDSLDPATAYSTFQKFIVGLINGLRDTRDLNGAS